MRQQGEPRTLAETRDQGTPTSATKAGDDGGGSMLGEEDRWLPALLQRWQTQAAVAPSRLMRSRGLHSEVPSEHAREIQQKWVELGNLVSKAAQTQAELHELLWKAGAAKDPKAIRETDLRLLQHLSLRKAVPEPETTRWTWTGFATRASNALETAAKVTYFVVITACGVVVIRENGVKPNLFTRKITGEGKIDD